MSPAIRAYLLLLTCGSCSAACGQTPRPDPANTYGNVLGTDAQIEHANDVLGFFGELLPTDVRRVDVAFAETWDEQHAACGWDAGCTTPEVNSYSVTVIWPEDRGTPAEFAYMLAHELCHVHYFGTGEMGDPNHTHTECFARPDRPDMYGTGVGYAWQVAENF